jgi:hypothetical protein
MVKSTTPEMARVYDAFLKGINEHQYSNYNRSENYIVHIGLNVDNIPFVFVILNYRDGRSRDEWQILQLYSERENIPQKYEFHVERKIKHTWGAPFDILEEYNEIIGDMVLEMMDIYLSEINPKLKMDFASWDTECAIDKLQ